MALGLKTKRTPSADEILKELEATLAAFTADPTVARTQRELERVRKASAEAAAREHACRGDLQRAGVRITRPELFQLAENLTAKIEAATRKLDELPKSAPTDDRAQHAITKTALLEHRASCEHELEDLQLRIASVDKRPTQAELLAAPADLRQAYRAAEAALAAATPAASFAEPLADAQHAAAAAKDHARRAAQPLALEALHDVIRRLLAALERATEEQQLLREVTGRIRSVLGPGVVDYVGFPLFERPGGVAASQFELWKSSLRSSVGYTAE